MWMWPTRTSTRSRSRRTLFLGLLLCVWLGVAAAPAGAQAPIVVLSQEQGYSFSASLTFTLKVRSSSALSEAILFYGRAKGPLVRRIYPEMPAGREVTIRYVEDLERGQFAPGTLFRVWWELHSVAGDVLVTEPVTFEYTDDNQDWQVLAGKRVDIYWYGDAQDAARTLSENAEAALTRLESEIGVAVAQRVRVYVYNNDADMDRAVASRSAGYDEMTVTLGMAVDDDTMLLLGSDDAADVTLAHELCHIVVGLATDNPYSGLPRWLDEGLAMYAQGRLDTRNQRALERGISDDALLSIRSMSSYSGQASQVDLFYGEAYSIVDFMLKEYGRDTMRALLGVFAKGSDQESALRQTLNVGLDQLDAIWRTSLGLGPRRTATPRPAADARTTATPSPTDAPATSSARTGTCRATTGLVLLPLAGAVVLATRRGGLAP